MVGLPSRAVVARLVCLWDELVGVPESARWQALGEMAREYVHSRVALLPDEDPREFLVWLQEIHEGLCEAGHAPEVEPFSEPHRILRKREQLKAALDERGA